MLFKIETRNPYNGDTEYYAVVAENENGAKINFSLQYPSYKVRNVCKIEENVVRVSE